MNVKLTKRQRQKLRREHKRTRERRHADRIKAILLLSDGWTYEEIAFVLLLDDATIRRWVECYLESGLEGLREDNYQGAKGKLTPEQEEDLKQHNKAKLISIDERNNRLCFRDLWHQL